MPSSSGGFAQIPVAADEPMFIYAKFPMDLDPVERTRRFADPLAIALEGSGFGTVTGGGTLFSEPDDDGNESVVYCGIDIDLTHPRAGIALLIDELRRLNAPPGTSLEFSVNDEPFEIDIYARSPSSPLALTSI